MVPQDHEDHEFEDGVPCIEPKLGSDDYYTIASLTKSTILDPRSIMPIHEVYPTTVLCMQLCELGCVDLSFVTLIVLEQKFSFDKISLVIVDLYPFYPVLQAQFFVVTLALCGTAGPCEGGW